MKRAAKVLAVLLSTVMAVTAMPVKNVSAGVISEVKTGYVAQAECVFAIDNKNISELTKDDEYKVRDAFYSLDDSGINRACSEHFQIIWGNNGTNSGRVNEEFVAGNLTNLENIWAFYVYGLEMEEPGISENESLRNVKYKTNLYISSTGLNDKVADDWAYMSVDSGSFGFMCLEVDAMRVDEPSWVVPHELAHVFTYHQGGAVAYEWYEATANWFRDQYLGSYYYAYNNNHYGPTSDFFAPFMLNSSYYFPHIRNWYDAWPILLYISENPDNIDGLGMELMHKLFENKQIDDTIFTTIERLSGVSIKTILGNMTRRLATMDFDRQEHYLNRLNETFSYDSSNYDKVYTSLQSADSDGYQTVPADRVPMQCGFNIIPLNADLSAKNLKLDFVNTSSEAGADFRVSLVTKCADNTTRYSEMINGGETKIELNGDETQAYLVVCATPDELKALEIGDENTVSTRYSYKVRVWTDNESDSSAGIPDTPVGEGTQIYTYGCENTYFTVVGTPKTGLSAPIEGSTLTQALKLNSGGSLTFTTVGDADVAVYVQGAKASNKFKVDNTEFTVTTSADKYTTKVGSGRHTIIRTSGESYLYYVAVTEKLGSTEEPEPEADADYTAVDTAIASIPSDLSIYTDESAAAVTAAKDAVVRGKKASEQAAVDAMANAIEDAVAALELKTVTEKKNGLCQNEEDGKWYYYVDDVIDTTKTGMVSYDGALWYVKNGAVNTEYKGLVYSGSWYYVSGGKQDTTYKGLTFCNNAWWYIKNGTIEKTYTGLVWHGETWWYVTNGKLDKTYKGVTSMNGNIWFVKDGKIAKSTGIWEQDGNIYYIVEGKVDKTVYGLKYYNGPWYYFRAGVVDWTYNTLAFTNEQWWYVNNGKLDKSYTGLVLFREQLWYVTEGKLDKTYAGTTQYNGQTYNVANGIGTLAE